jgi:hypothetical protein
MNMQNHLPEEPTKITTQTTVNKRIPSKEETLASELLRYLEKVISDRAIKLAQSTDKDSHNTLITHYKNACVSYADHLRSQNLHLMAQLVMDKFDKS